MDKIKETTALKKLGINSFREVTKEKVMELMSMIPDMEPEVAIKALEQFPQFVSCATKALADYKETIIQMIASADKGLEDVLRGRLIEIEELCKMLEDETVTFEQKIEVAALIKELGNLNSEELEKHRDFLTKAAELIGVVVVAAIFGTASILGGRARVGV